mmetsp:Transcript_9582/g.10729  ORF Transcript_9582/g.10729 Transcript_9582/m.10729 type:complete len:99 (+) Transcript_9582:36-332(+)
MSFTKEQIQEFANNEEKFNEAVEALFTKFDENANGVLEKSELAKVAAFFAEQKGMPAPSEDDVKKLLDEMDTNNDSVISFEEFKEFGKRMLTSIAETL